MSPRPFFPVWLNALATASLVAAALCSTIIAVDLVRRPQKMWIMNLVWPLCALFGGVLWLAFYLRWGRGMPRHRPGRMGSGAERETPMAIAVAEGASHCGAGCTLGDIVAEWLAFLVPGVAVAFGWGSIFPEKTFAVWVLDYLVAFAVGVAFQYFTIKPIRELSAGEGLLQAIKADAASITSWQVGMYGFMAIAQFLWFRRLYGGVAEVNTPEFWFAMQLAMLCGFTTSYPVNWLLVKSGVKERM